MKKLKLTTKYALPETKALEFYTTILLFSFYTFCLSTSIVYAENSPEQSSTTTDKKKSHLLIAQNPTTDLGRQLWQVRITNPKDGKSDKSRSELYYIIEKIRSVEFELQDKSVKPLIAIEPAQKNTPDETSLDSNVPKETLCDKRQDEEHLPYKKITNQTLQIFEQISQQPQQLENPLELAEILFSNGNLKEAAKCYQEALNRITANENDRNEDKAWILFQIGNCLRNENQSAAIEKYSQLIAEHPDSPWADLAKARSKLINWYQQDKPEELLAQNQP